MDDKTAEEMVWTVGRDGLLIGVVGDELILVEHDFVGDEDGVALEDLVC